MSIAQARHPKFSGKVFGVVSALILLTACSTPKTAAVPAAKPVPAAVAAAAASVQHQGDSNQNDPAQPADPYVTAIRAGTITGYPSATIGKAFETAFSSAHWQSEQRKEGARVVTFTGLLPANARSGCSAVLPCTQDAKVTFEWTFTSDGQLFHLSYIDPEPWPEDRRSTREMLLFIYG
jgi:hypothetical protein